MEAVHLRPLPGRCVPEHQQHRGEKSLFGENKGKASLKFSLLGNIIVKKEKLFFNPLMFCI
jgi:hypothetical protein